MSLITLTTANTAYPLATRGSSPSNSITTQWCASVNIEIISVSGTSILTTPSTAVVCFGAPPPLGTGSSVSTSAFDARMDGTTNTSYTWGLGNDDCNNVDLSLCYLVSGTNNVVVSINPRTV